MKVILINTTCFCGGNIDTVVGNHQCDKCGTRFRLENHAVFVGGVSGIDVPMPESERFHEMADKIDMLRCFCWYIAARFNLIDCLSAGAEEKIDDIVCDHCGINIQKIYAERDAVGDAYRAKMVAS